MNSAFHALFLLLWCCSLAALVPILTPTSSSNSPSPLTFAAAEQLFNQTCFNDYSGLDVRTINNPPAAPSVDADGTPVYTIAQLVHGPDSSPDLLVTGREGAYDFTAPLSSQVSPDPVTLTAWSGLQHVLNRMAEKRNHTLQLKNGATMKLAVVFVNIGPLYDPATNWTTLHPNLRARAKRIANQVSSGAYPIVLTPPYTDAVSVTDVFSLACHQTKLCLHIATYQTSPFSYVCPPPPLKFSLCDGRSPGDRRFTNTLGLFPQTDLAWQGFVNALNLLGAKTCAIISTGSGASSPDPSVHMTLPPALSYGAVELVYANKDSFTTAVGGYLSPDQVSRMVDDLQRIDPDFIVASGAAGVASGKANLIAILAEFERRNYVPKGFLVTGSLENDVARTLGPRTVDYFFSLTLWNPQLRGGDYKATGNDLFASDAVNDSPAVFWDSYLREFGASSGNPITAPFSMVRENVGHVQLGAMGVYSAIRLIEESFGMNSTAALAAAAYSIQSPSFGGAIAFDRVGRRPAYTYPVLQHLPRYDPTGLFPPVVFPLYTRVPIVYPMPTYEERQLDEWHLYTSNRVLSLAVQIVGAVCIIYILVLMAGVIKYRDSPVIKAAMPDFCLIVLGGALLMLISTYGSGLYVSRSLCTMSVWLLTTGFTVMFSALTIKLWTVWRIFQAVAKPGGLSLRITPRYLLYAIVCAVLLVDVIINSVWTLHGPIDVELVLVDVDRPLYNYYQCSMSSPVSRRCLQATLILKGILVLASLALSFLSRKIPSSFNESTFVGLAVYNVSIISCFLLPLVGSGIGGYVTTSAVRNFGIELFVVSTCTLVLGHKFYLISTGRTEVNIRYAVSATGETLGTKSNSHERASGGTERERSSAGRVGTGAAAGPSAGPSGGVGVVSRPLEPRGSSSVSSGNAMPPRSVGMSPRSAPAAGLGGSPPRVGAVPPLAEHANEGTAVESEGLMKEQSKSQRAKSINRI